MDQTRHVDVSQSLVDEFCKRRIVDDFLKLGRDTAGPDAPCEELHWQWNLSVYGKKDFETSEAC